CDSLHFDPAQLFGDPDWHIGVLTYGRIVAPKDTIIYTVYLNPAAKGLRQGMLVLASHGMNSEIDSIPFTCIIHEGTKILASSVAVLDFGLVSVCDRKDTLVTLHNSGCDTVRVSGFRFQGSGFGSA